MYEQHAVMDEDHHCAHSVAHETVDLLGVLADDFGEVWIHGNLLDYDADGS